MDHPQPPRPKDRLAGGRAILRRRPAGGPAGLRARRLGQAGLLAVVVVALTLGLRGAEPLLNGPADIGTRGSSAVPAPSAAGSARPPQTPGSTPGTRTPVPIESGATVGATPIPVQTAATATITFNGLMLDPAIDPAAATRTFTFVSDGPGTVSAEVVSTSLADTSELCMAEEASPGHCASGATPDVVGFAPAGQTRWTVTIRSVNEASPTVDLAISWPAKAPAITAANCRFQGSPNPDTLRSLAATFKARTTGSVTVDAAWPPAIVDASVTLTDAGGPNPTQVDSQVYPAAGSISPAYSHAVVAGRTYRLTIFNESPDTGRTVLTATIAFP